MCSQGSRAFPDPKQNGRQSRWPLFASLRRDMTVRTQDIGGVQGYGAIPIADGPAFNGRWEASVVAGILATLAAGAYNVDEFRAPMDELPPLAYMSLPY